MGGDEESTPLSIYPRKETPVPSVSEAGRTPETAWAICSKENLLLLSLIAAPSIGSSHYSDYIIRILLN